MAEVVRRVPVPHFDPEGDPEIRVLSDGSLHLCFNFMPPSFIPETEGEDLGRFKDFDQQIAAAIGVEVLWDDRELFIIPAPQGDTLVRLQQFLRDQGAR